MSSLHDPFSSELQHRGQEYRDVLGHSHLHPLSIDRARALRSTSAKTKERHVYMRSWVEVLEVVRI
jgi:hypothetical protein